LLLKGSIELLDLGRESGEKFSALDPTFFNGYQNTGLSSIGFNVFDLELTVVAPICGHFSNSTDSFAAGSDWKLSLRVSKWKSQGCNSKLRK
jgi:hypothetical protein